MHAPAPSPKVIAADVLKREQEQRIAAAKRRLATADKKFAAYSRGPR